MKIVAYSTTLLATASFVGALPACDVRVAQQQQQQQQQKQQQCTMDMLKGFMITSPVNFVAQPEQILPERAQFIDPTNTTILLTDQQTAGAQNETMSVKFTNETEISTEVLQNSAFAISWMRSGQGQQTQQEKINPVRVQLVNQEGKLFNVTETLGVLATGGQQQQRQQQQQQQQQQGNQTTTPPPVQASQQQQGNQTTVTPPQAGQQQGNQTGAVVVYLGPEIKPGMYAFLLSAQVQPQQQGGQQQQQQQGPLCKVMTMPFRIRSVSDLGQQGGATNATAAA